MSEKEKSKFEPAEVGQSGPDQKTELEFASPETAVVHKQIQEALDSGDFAAVIQLATKARDLESKAKYDKEVAERQIKETEKNKRAVIEKLQNIKARYDLLVADTERNPFLNPDYKKEFDGIIKELSDIASSDSPRKTYDFGQGLDNLIKNLKIKVDRMRNSDRYKDESASSIVGSNVSVMANFAEGLKTDFTKLKLENVPWDELKKELAAFIK